MSQSLAPECNEIKERYDTCFLKWYSEKYLRGIGTTDNNECAVLFKEYSTCLKGALKARGIDKLLDEAREDNKENDATLMGKKKCEYTAIFSCQAEILDIGIYLLLIRRALTNFLCRTACDGEPEEIAGFCHAVGLPAVVLL
ncbi:hypothetical protein B0J18DRAFT_437692 [Chaetomium sp. MPI-SDFR-AT-0129]|nr:hypothetical protein B0J18DRAFT_437692 [Chaetomium sp. MPI-SDFR-AT-0129]